MHASRGSFDSSGTAMLRGIRRRRRRATIRKLLPVIALAAAVPGSVHLLQRSAGGPAPAAKGPGPAAPAPIAEPARAAPAAAVREAPEAVAAPALPALDESDERVRALTASAGIDLARWLVGPDLVRRFTVSVDNIAEGKTPRRHWRGIGPASPFRATSEPDGLRVDPRSHARYDLLARSFASLDAELCAGLYRSLRPLIDEAYRDLGNPGRDFDETLARAIDLLLRTPVADALPELTLGVKSYRYRDSALEGLSPAQKQLLRLGPGNARRVQEKLREIASALQRST